MKPNKVQAKIIMIAVILSAIIILFLIPLELTVPLKTPFSDGQGNTFETFTYKRLYQYIWSDIILGQKDLVKAAKDGNYDLYSE